ncbi:MAG: double zinc ribbon domain-containing protein [Deinococcales bacterium]
METIYKICPKCARVTPSSLSEQYCANDGAKLLEACPHCQKPFTNPYSRYCPHCGNEIRKNRQLVVQ